MGRRIVAIFAAAVMALVGVVAVMVYARGAEARAVAGQVPTDVYVAQQVIPSGTTVDDAVKKGLLVKTAVPAKAAPAGALSKVTSENGSLLALTDIQPGEYVVQSRFGTTPIGTKAIDVPAGHVAVSVQLSDSARVGTFLTPGSNVVLYDSFDQAAGGAAGAGTLTRVLLDDVLVIAVGTSSLIPVGGSGADVPPPAAASTMVTVAVTPAEATRLVHGIQTGRLYAALRGSNAKVDLGTSVSSTNLFSVK